MTQRLLTGLCVQAALFWALVFVLRSASVALAAWWLLYGVLALAFWGTHRWRPTASLAPRAWGALAGYALLGALVFAGANFALDTLNGAHRAKAQVAAHLGGLELWFVLCPGVCSLALGRLAGGLRPTARRHRS